MTLFRKFHAVWGVLLFMPIAVAGYAAEMPDSSSKSVIVVTPQVFAETLKPWIAYRTAQGFEVHLLVEQAETARLETIRKRIRELAQRTTPTALLLVGNARDGVVPAPKIPCRVIQNFGEEKDLASDDWYADLDDDGHADLAVGRFPVDSAPQLESLIRKTIAYETSLVFRSRKIQVVAGTGNFSAMLDGVIETAVRHAISETVPPDWDLALLHADPASSFCPFPLDFRDELIETLNRAPLFWAYFGHGQHRMLDMLSTPVGYAPTLDAGDVSRIACRNGFPVALLFCCYGGFLDRDTPSLAEEMVLQPGGPVAVIAASRTTMPYGMSVLGVELFRELLQNRVESGENRVELGALLLAAKCRMASEIEAAPSDGPGRARSGIRKKLEVMAKSFDPTGTRLDVQLQEHAAMFHLFGDPLLKIPLPGRIHLTAPRRCRPDETIRISGRFDRIPSNGEQISQTVSVELLPALERIVLRSPDRDVRQIRLAERDAQNREYTASNKRVIVVKEASFSDHEEESHFTTELTLPEIPAGRYVLRASYPATSCTAMGYADISVGFRRDGK